LNRHFEKEGEEILNRLNHLHRKKDSKNMKEKMINTDVNNLVDTLMSKPTFNEKEMTKKLLKDDAFVITHLIK